MVNHRPRNFFWRRVFDHSVFLALTNAFLLFSWWVNECTTGAIEALQILDADGKMHPNDVVPRGAASGMTRASVAAILLRLKSMARLVGDRALWMRTMSAFLISKSTRGDVVSEWDRKPRPSNWTGIEPTWVRVLPTARACNAPKCIVKTRHACRCTWCSDEGVVICQKCVTNTRKHRAAGDNRKHRGGKKRAKKPIPWETLSRDMGARGRVSGRAGEDNDLGQV